MYSGQTLEEFLSEDEEFTKKINSMTEPQRAEYISLVRKLMHSVRGVRFICNAGCFCREEVTKVPDTAAE